MNMKKETYPEWICNKCATSIKGHRKPVCSTIHEDVCGVCGLITMVTEPRDYGYPIITTKDIKRLRVKVKL